MTFPSGTPGGYPGQGPQQTNQPYPGAPSTGRAALPLPQILLLATGGLGVLNLFLAFANVGGDKSFYQAGLGWIPALLLVAGVTAVIGYLPGDAKPGPWPAVLSVGVVLAYLFTVFQVDGLGAGGVLVLIFGLAQLGTAVAAYLLDAGILKPGGAKPQPYGQGFAPQTGGFGQPQQGPAQGHQPQQGQPQHSQFGGAPQSQPGQQPGQPGQPGQHSQPGQPGQHGQPGQPGSSSEASGGMAQPTKFAEPVQPPQQQPTAYAPQHGQFFQQLSGESNPGQQGSTGPSGS